jgi:hypothetical protein
MPVIYLHTEADWEQAVARVNALIAQGFGHDKARQTEVATLADAIQEFEQRQGWAPQTRAKASVRS